MKEVFQTISRSLILIGALAAGALGQISGVADEGVDPDQLVLRYYTSRVLGEEELQEVANALFGGQVRISSQDTDGDFYVGRFLTLQDSLIVRDTAERADAILQKLAEIEDALYPPEEDRQPAPEPESLEYAPRFLTTHAAMDALQDFRRTVRQPTPDGGWVEVDNMSQFEERNMLLLRETPERLAEIRARLATVDVPVPQATFSYLIVRGHRTGAAGDASSGLPDELTRDLQAMIPVQRLELVASGVLRASLQTSFGIDTDVDVNTRFELRARPSAFDRESGELTLHECRFRATTRDPQSDQGFETALSLRPGEYTVIGSTGSDPLFVVLRMQL